MRRQVFVVALGLGLLGWSIPTGASAQAAPAAAAQHSEHVGTREDEDDIRLLLSAGSALTYGNARNLAINVGADFLARMGQHAFIAQIGWIYGIASQQDATTFVFGDWKDSANNLTWRLRYDFFVDDDDALFVAHYGRRDPFAALEPRIGAQVGYMRNFIREDSHRFWGEIGYDFAYDNFGGQVLQVGTDNAGMEITSTDRTLHSLRLFIGYDNHINEVLTYQTGLEALMRLDRPEHWRFQWVNQLRSKIADWLQISLDLTGRFDSLPPGQAQAWNEAAVQRTRMLDVIVTLNLVGTFDMYTEQVEEAEEEEEAAAACEPCVCPESASPSAAGSEGEAAPSDTAAPDTAATGTAPDTATPDTAAPESAAPEVSETPVPEAPQT